MLFEFRQRHHGVVAGDAQHRCPQLEQAALGEPRGDLGAEAAAERRFVHDHRATGARLGLGLSIAIYEPGFLRNALTYWRLGRIPRGSMVKFYFGGEAGYFGGGSGVSFGLPPTAKALDAYLEMMELAACPLPWSVAVMGGDLFATPLARLALERGGHLHTGLEDHLGAGQPGNLELTQRAVALCRAVGRPVAEPGEAARILGLP